MNRTIGKIKDTGGVTMLMGLVMVLVATLASCAVLAAASTSAKNIAGDRSSQQAYLTVSSAAALVRDKFTAENPTYSVVQKTESTYANSTGTVTNETTQATGAFAALINAGMVEAAKGKNYTSEFTVSADGLSDVKAEFSMSANRSITVVFSINNSAGNKMELQFTCKKEEETVETSSGTGTRKETTKVVTTTYTWQARDITKVDA